MQPARSIQTKKPTFPLLIPISGRYGVGKSTIAGFIQERVGVELAKETSIIVETNADRGDSVTFAKRIEEAAKTSKIVIIEGLFLMNNTYIAMNAFQSIWIDCDADAALCKKLRGICRECCSGDSASPSVLTVLANYERDIKPKMQTPLLDKLRKQHSMIIDNTKNIEPESLQFICDGIIAAVARAQN